MTRAIEIRDLQKRYARGESTVDVLEHIDLDVEQGEFVALMGPSGSGKTTILNIVAGIDHPSSGSVSVEGKDILAMSDSEKTAWRTRTVGYVFQFHNLLPVLTAAENIELPLLLLPLSKKERREHVAAAFEAVGLEGRDDHRPSELSGGEEQRVAIARAIVTDSRILLADEPTGSLDAESAEGIMVLLERLNGELGKTVVLVTHDSKAAGHAGRCLRIDKGRLADDARKVAGDA
jgi:putative ABC transport system ATP-binding protein